MSTNEFLVVIGTIWIAPHLNPSYCQITGLIFLLVAVCKGLGLI